MWLEIASKIAIIELKETVRGFDDEPKNLLRRANVGNIGVYLIDDGVWRTMKT